MPFHMVRSSQKAKDGLFKAEVRHNPGDSLTKASRSQLTVSNPPSLSRLLSLRNLMLLALCLTLILILFIFLALSTIYFMRKSSLDVPPNNIPLRKLKRRKPPSLDLNKDLEAQPRLPRCRNPFDPTPTPTTSTSSADDENAIATGVSLTPFTPLRERTMRWAFGVAEAEAERGVTDEDDSLGLDQYFFDDGVGIKRYESGAKERRWKNV